MEGRGISSVFPTSSRVLLGFSLVEPLFMVTFGVEDVRDDIVSGSFFSFRFFEDSKRN